MFYLGIDIGKNFHVASLLDERQNVIFQDFEFKNTTDDAKRLLEKLKPYLELENVVNPIQTDSWRNSTKIRPHKTDKIDSLVIADFIRYGDFSDTTLASEEILELRNSNFNFKVYLLTFLLLSKIAELLEEFKSPITTIPGIGNVISATILSEVGDISRFSSPAKLVAYAGLDAKISQSGTSQNSTGKMTKRGSPYLRTALFRAAFIASNSDPVFKAFYEKKRAEGKHHFTCVGAVARKLCYTVHAILSKNSPYEILS